MPETFDLLIISAGKLGREMLGWVYDAIADGAPWQFKGFLDDRADALQTFGYEEPVLGPVEKYQPRPNDRFLCAVGDIGWRRKYTDIIRVRGGVFATLIHPTAVIGRRVEIAPGAGIAPFVSIGADVRIGESTLIGSHSNVSHDNQLGAYCQLSGHACFGGNVTLEDYVFVGLGAIIVPGTTVRAHGFIGAGSVVLQDVPAATKVFGNPAMPIGTVPVSVHR